ncbi:MAG: glycosyltransferase family 2 protein [Acidobacteriota bacterium]|nr:glycosyltransferase family 2 protein [Acidobacteriota bacterium]
MEARNQDVFVVIPAYNEGEVLRRTVLGVLPLGYQVVVVDDGSAVPALSMLADLPIYYVQHLSNLGQGAALQTGMQAALLRGAEIVVHFDADGQHPSRLIERLIAPIRSGKCEVVLGSRFLDPEDRRLVPRKKRLLLKAGVLVSWMFTRVWLTDTHNGFRALSRKAASQIQLRENGFAHATEILDLIHKANLSYGEVPATIRYTDYSMAKGQNMFNSINIVIDLILRKLTR